MVANLHVSTQPHVSAHVSAHKQKNTQSESESAGPIAARSVRGLLLRGVEPICMRVGTQTFFVSHIPTSTLYRTVVRVSYRILTSPKRPYVHQAAYEPAIHSIPTAIPPCEDALFPRMMQSRNVTFAPSRAATTPPVAPFPSDSSTSCTSKVDPLTTKSGTSPWPSIVAVELPVIASDVPLASSRG